MADGAALEQINDQIKKLELYRSYIEIFEKGALYFLNCKSPYMVGYIEMREEIKLIVEGIKIIEDNHWGWTLISNLVSYTPDSILLVVGGGRIRFSNIEEMRHIKIEELPLYLSWEKTDRYKEILKRV